MKRNNDPQRRLSPRKVALLLEALALCALAAFYLLFRPQQPVAELASISDVAAGIADGQIIKIEDTPSLGELVIYFRDGRTEKGLRDPGAPLLEQLNLLGLKDSQLSKVEFRILNRASPTSSPLAGGLLLVSLIGVAGMVVVRSKKNDTWGKKEFSQALIPNLRFRDVAGLEDNLQELRDVVTFLKEGDRYADMGARMPRGVLMVGDPGTGKTLIAKAVAGEAGVPFYATSGSEFTEVFVGVGASRIRSLFRKARKKAPCIIFIDEIDAVGRSRHRSESGAEMEQDQTLNQLLVEMDGFESGEGVIVLAATNRLDVLDSALTRPGRFDRRVYINRPDVKGRESIFRLHAQTKRLAPEINFVNLAKATPGLVGADLANIVNEAAINAVRNHHSEIHMLDFEEAIEKHIAGGVARKSHVMNEAEKKIVAFHEAGHAVVMHATQLSDLVYKISIIPRGQAGGYTMALPDSDMMLMSRGRILARITGLLGGRAAEEVFFQDVTSGASNDLDVATHLAEEMVMRLGMDSQAGLRVFPQVGGRPTLAAASGSQKTFETIDQAVSKILDECYAEARRIIVEQRVYVEQVSYRLLEVETIDRGQFVEMMNAASQSILS